MRFILRILVLNDMQVRIFVRAGRKQDDHCSFVPDTYSAEKTVIVEVPDGCEFVGANDLTCLKTPEGRIHTAHDILLLGTSKAHGFQRLD